VAAEFPTLQSLVARARRNLTRGDWDYLATGADAEVSLKRNRLAFEKRALKARVFTDVSEVSVSREFLGVDLRIPVLLAPIGSVQVFEAGGGLSVARAAEQFGVMQILSSVCTPDFETVARESAAPKIYQLYVHGEESWVMDIVERTQDAGYKAFCLTVDTQVGSRRERDILKGYLPMAARRQPGSPPPRNYSSLQARITWDFIERIRARLRIPLVLKGIACAEDAAAAAERGVEVIYVSNHGGRQLDQGRASLDTLPEIVDAVRGRAKVVVDGGILRGTDVLKALALGADAVGVGRLECFGLAAAGTAGVVRMLELLEIEMRINLALMGVASIDDLTPDVVLPADPVGPPHVLSGFPLLDEDY
jgi:glycolate oxidase